MTNLVYFNAGENATQPWHVGLHNGTCIVERFGRFTDVVAAIRFALDTVSAANEFPVKWPDDLKVVIN